ncbi:hypothetical protein E2C01_037217 [Portunus trituberculatus]|uniref:Uncharacterized protein n=1 Tax=Portunus trituberculatus TaxID=210409 RepID=A0A5B7FDD6_PORTR|nr:hypothetical protein [Portunus trituberculatus]
MNTERNVNVLIHFFHLLATVDGAWVIENSGGYVTSNGILGVLPFLRGAPCKDLNCRYGSPYGAKLFFMSLKRE